MATLTEPAGPATDRGGYLWETLAVLWPSRRVSSGAGGGPRGGLAARPGGGQTEFLVLPNEARAVLLLPRRPRRAAAAALRHYKASAVGRQRLGFRGLALAAQLGLADVLPQRITIGRRPGTSPTRMWWPTCARSWTATWWPACASARPGRTASQCWSCSARMVGCWVREGGHHRPDPGTGPGRGDRAGRARGGRADPPGGAPAAPPRPVARARGPGPGAAEGFRAAGDPGRADVGHGGTGHGAGSDHPAGRPERLLAGAAIAAGGVRWSRAGGGAAADHGGHASHRGGHQPGLRLMARRLDPVEHGVFRRAGAGLGLGAVRDRRAHRLRRPALPAAGGRGSATAPGRRQRPRRRCSPPP